MKNKFRERSIRASLFPYVEKLLKTGGVDYSYDGNGHLTTSLTSKMYHRTCTGTARGQREAHSSF